MHKGDLLDFDEMGLECFDGRAGGVSERIFDFCQSGYQAAHKLLIIWLEQKSLVSRQSLQVVTERCSVCGQQLAIMLDLCYDACLFGVGGIDTHYGACRLACVGWAGSGLG